MGIIWLLKSLADISAFYLFTAPLAAFFGGSGLLWCALLQSAAYALARWIPKKWILPLPVLLLALCYWLCRDNLASLAAVTPGTIYLLWQYFRKPAVPDLANQQEILGDLWKLVGIATPVSLLIGEVMPLISFALLIFGTNVALLRTLRHNPEVYLRPSFQLTNLGILAAIPLVSLFVGTGPVANLIGSGLKWLYLDVILPIVRGIVYYPILWIYNFFAYLGSFFHLDEKPQETTEPLGDLEGPPEVPSIDAQQVRETGQVLQVILILLLAIVAIAGMILLMRKLGRNNSKVTETKEPKQQRTTITATGKHPTTEDSSTVQAVRKHYRRYLKLCVKSGIPVEQSSTIGDVCRKALERKNLQPQAHRIRQLYIRARYAGQATREDAKEMATLCTESKKEK